MILKYFIKVFISSGIIVLVSEIAKKNNLFGGFIASIPLISVLSMIWLYIDTNDIDKVKALSNGILWMVAPSMALFIIFPILVNYGIKFYLSLTISILITMVCYGLTIFVMNYFGFKV
tara:strand:- start:60 stop:413 length:354 start_codon:yes stop_codon:yes gene_type:complete